MKRSVFVLFALLASIACTQSPAVAQPAGMSAVSGGVVAPSPIGDAAFFASLSSLGDLDATATPRVCQASSDCPADYKCCYPCGIPDCNFICMKVKRCPLIP
jgi:hypothetical protein